MHLDDTTRMVHMLESAKEAQSFVSGKHREDLYEDRMLVLALVRRIEVIGEAASQVSKPGRERYAELPWRVMIGALHFLVEIPPGSPAVLL